MNKDFKLKRFHKSKASINKIKNLKPKIKYNRNFETFHI